MLTSRDREVTAALRGRAGNERTLAVSLKSDAAATSRAVRNVGKGGDVMPMPYRQSGLIKAAAEYHAAEAADVSPARSPVDFLKITRDAARLSVVRVFETTGGVI